MEPDPKSPEDDKTPPEPPSSPGGGNVEELPPWAREAINKANREAANYRAKAKELEPFAKRAKELEEAGKSEVEKLTADRDTHRTRAQEAELALVRLDVALEKGLTKGQAKRLVGSTREELEADADELLAELGGGTGGGDKKGGQNGGRPKEKLRPGAVPEAEPEENDPRALAAKIPRR